jgi:hypothetical protein
MKKLYVFTVLFFLIGGLFTVYAQDLIILKDGNTIEAKVIEISPTEIRYKRFDYLDGPTIVILAENVLSIRYENGSTDIINAVPARTADSTQQPTADLADIARRNARFNSIGGSVGYLGVSNFGFSLFGTVSPANYTFFDFNLGLGFDSFSFNGNASFNGFVPFKNGGWYIGLGIGGGLYEFGDEMNGFFAVNAITGLILFNWLNISATANMEVVPEFNFRFKPMVGYVYRFGKPQQEAIASTSDISSAERDASEEFVSASDKFSLDGKRIFAVSGLGIVGEGFGGGITVTIFEKYSPGRVIGPSIFITAKWINSTNGIEVNSKFSDNHFNLFSGGIGILLKRRFTEQDRIIYNVGLSLEYLAGSMSTKYQNYDDTILDLGGDVSKLGFGLQTGLSFRIHPNISLDLNGIVKLGFGNVPIGSETSGSGFTWFPHALGAELGITYMLPY